MYCASKVNDQPKWVPFHAVPPKPVRYNLSDKKVYQNCYKMKQLGNQAFCQDPTKQSNLKEI